MRLMLTRLSRNSPAATSSAVDSAIWAATRPARKRAAARAPDGWPALPARAPSPGPAGCCAGPGRGRRGCRWPGPGRRRRRSPADRGGSRGTTTVSGGSSETISVRVQRAKARPASAAQGGQQTRLGEQLADQRAASGADRQPHRHLGVARRPPGQEQVGDVGAGDQQHDPGDREEQDERRPRLPVERALAARGPARPRPRRARKRSIVASLIPSCSGASTSLTRAW